MPFVSKDVEGAYARWDAQIRPITRRQLAFSIHIVIVALFVAIISVGFGRTSATLSDRQQVPVGAPADHHAVVLV